MMVGMLMSMIDWTGYTSMHECLLAPTISSSVSVQPSNRVHSPMQQSELLAY